MLLSCSLQPSTFLCPFCGLLKAEAKGIAWILLTFARRDDHRDSGNVLSWTELLNLNSALHCPRPSTIRFSMIQKQSKKHHWSHPGSKQTWGCFQRTQPCTFHPALLLTLPCTPSQITQSLSKARSFAQSWAEMAAKISTLRAVAISEHSSRPGIQTQIDLLALAEPHAQTSKSQGTHLIRSWEDWRDWTQSQNKSTVKY